MPRPSNARSTMTPDRQRQARQRGEARVEPLQAGQIEVQPRRRQPAATAAPAASASGVSAMHHAQVGRGAKATLQLAGGRVELPMHLQRAQRLRTGAGSAARISCNAQASAPARAGDSPPCHATPPACPAHAMPRSVSRSPPASRRRALPAKHRIPVHRPPGDSSSCACISVSHTPGRPAGQLAVREITREEDVTSGDSSLPRARPKDRRARHSL